MAGSRIQNLRWRLQDLGLLAFRPTEPSAPWWVMAHAQDPPLMLGVDIRRALVEVAGSLGGDEFEAEIYRLAGDRHNPYPHRAAWERLEERFPGSSQNVRKRSREIMRWRHAQEREAMDWVLRRP